MPALAGPYQTFVFTGTLTSGSTDRHGHHQHRRAWPSATSSPAPASRPGRRSCRSTVRPTASRSRRRRRPPASRASPRPIPRPPRTPTCCWPRPTARALRHQPGADAAARHHRDRPDRHVRDAAGGTPIVTTASPTIDGLSEISGFGSTTWVTIVDETPGDATYGQVIGGFDPQTYAVRPVDHAQLEQLDRRLRQLRHPARHAFGSNGLKTIEVYATDDAGSSSVPSRSRSCSTPTTSRTPRRRRHPRRRPWSSRPPRRRTPSSMASR